MLISIDQARGTRLHSRNRCRHSHIVPTLSRPISSACKQTLPYCVSVTRYISALGIQFFNPSYEIIFLMINAMWKRCAAPAMSPIAPAAFTASALKTALTKTAPTIAAEELKMARWVIEMKTYRTDPNEWNMRKKVVVGRTGFVSMLSDSRMKKHSSQ